MLTYAALLNISDETKLSSNETGFLSNIEEVYTVDQLLWFRKYARAEMLSERDVAVMDNVVSSFKNLFDSKAKAEDVL